MKKQFLFLIAAAVVALGVASCNNDNGNDTPREYPTMIVSGTIANMPGGDGFTLKALLYDAAGEQTIIASADVKGGKFSITLPELDEKLLTSDYELDKWEVVSNHKTKLTASDITFRLFKGEKDSGTIVCQREDGVNTTKLHYVFADSATRITGSSSSVLTYEKGGKEYEYTVTRRTDIVMTKGWNRFVDTYKEDAKGNEEYSEVSAVPAGLAWSFFMDEE